ncbi:Mu transposase C-terminal domain-containing protein [Pseudomonas asiatica]|uniref:Mu transposase C-terminal domain-containing protein n=1 Tax=Pseudomonas asiatica TaxID=2219225 RepID=UPI003B960354
MSNQIRIGDLVTVDEVSEALDAKSRNVAANTKKTADDRTDESTTHSSATMAGAECEVDESLIQKPSIYEVISYDLKSNTCRIKSRIGIEVVRTVSVSNVIKADSFFQQAATEALASRREHGFGTLSEDDPIPVTEARSAAEVEAKRRTEIIAKHCAKVDPLPKSLALEELGVGETIFYKIKRIYNANPDWRAQLAGRDGRRPGEKRIDPEVDEIIFKAFETHRKGYGANDAEAIDEIELQCKKRNKRPPSRTTVWRRWHELSAREHLKATDGPEAAQAVFGHYPTPTVEEFYPGRIHDIDHTPLDCHGIDSVTGMALGRAYLTLVRDRDTKGLMGFALLYGAPKRASISAAIYMALRPKTDLLAKHGMSHLHWPLYGKPDQYVVDHGSDLMAESFRIACSTEEITHIPRLRPPSGGGIERALGVLNRRLAQTLEGGTASATKKGPGYQPDKKAVYTLEALTAIIIAWICKFNNRKGSDGLSPNQRFERKYGLHDGVVVLPSMVSSPERFVINILQGHKVTVARNGVVTRGLVYEFGPFTKMVGEELYIKVDPNNLHRIWGRLGGEWHALWLVNKQTQPLTLAEQKLILRSRFADEEPDLKRLDAQEQLNRVKLEGKKQARAIRKAQEDVAQIDRMGHFGNSQEPPNPEVSVTPPTLPIIILELDEDI